MIPSVTFACPKQTLSVFEVMTVQTSIVHVLVILLLDKGAHLTCLCRHLEQTVGVVPTFIKLKVNRLSVLVPVGRELILKEEDGLNIVVSKREKRGRSALRAERSGYRRDGHTALVDALCLLRRVVGDRHIDDGNIRRSKLAV